MNDIREKDGIESGLLTVKRGMMVLRAFRSDATALTNAELVRRTGLPKATISRLTSTLLHEGFLSHVPGGRKFELATGPHGIGHAFLAHSELLHKANPILQQLADELNVSVALGIRDGLDMLYVGYRASHKVATLRLGVGSLLPMGLTAIGRAYLWGLPPEEQKPLVDELLRTQGDLDFSMEQELTNSFAELESTGTCAVLGGYQHGSYAIALPIVVGPAHTVMGLSCGKADIRPDLNHERARIASPLRKAARQLEALLVDQE